MNPILKREFLARWRDKRSHLLLLSLALLLAIASYHSYDNALNTLPLQPYNLPPGTVVEESLTTRASRAGHALFTTLAIGNVGMWFILAPLLLATGVAKERERGLLESLQLSPMRPVSQIVARVLSALSYLAILQVITLPIYFVALSFGGVSELEILRIWEIVAVSAFCGVGLGLALSAQSPRPSSALFGAVALLVAWCVIAVVGSNYIHWIKYLGFGRWANVISHGLIYSLPPGLAWSLCQPPSTAAPLFTGWVRLSPEEFLPVALWVWGAVGLLGLVKATRDVTRPLPPSSWAGRNTLIQKWKQRREERLKAQQEKRSAKVSVEGALLADLPFDRLIRFKNPLLNREVKSRFRLRRASPWVWSGRTLVFLVGAGVWVTVLFSVFLDPPGRPGAVPLVLWSEWLLGTALIATFAASSFAREREAGTWEGIRLSLMTPREIMRTKWASPLVAFALLSCPLWLLLVPLLPIGDWPGVPFRWMMLSVLVIVSSLCLTSALGSWISVRAKSTASATCWTIGILLAVTVGAPLTFDAFKVPNRIALWRYGLQGESLDSTFDSPQNLAVYALKTGISVQRPYSNGRTPTTVDFQRWTDYYNWFQKMDNEVWRFQKSLYFWNTVSLLAALQDRDKPSLNYGTRYGSLGEETITNMALLYIALAGMATIGLLYGLNSRLQKNLD